MTARSSWPSSGSRWTWSPGSARRRPAACRIGRIPVVLADGLFAPTGRRLALAALLPDPRRRVAVVPGPAHLGPVRVVPHRHRTPTATAWPHPSFWNGRAQVGRLRSLHIAVAFATLDAVLLGVLVPHDRHPAGYVLAAVTALILLLGVLAVTLRAVVHRDTPAGWAKPFTRILQPRRRRADRPRPRRTPASAATRGRPPTGCRSSAAPSPSFRRAGPADAGPRRGGPGHPPEARSCRGCGAADRQHRPRRRGRVRRRRWPTGSPTSSTGAALPSTADYRRGPARDQPPPAVPSGPPPASS